MNSKMQRAGREPSSSTTLAAQTVFLIHHHDLPGLDLTDEVGADDVEACGLAADDGVTLVVPQAQRTHPVRIAEADERLAAHDRRREGTSDLRHGVAHGAEQVALGVIRDQSRDHLGVGRPGELHALPHELLTQLCRVDEVAVVAKRDHVAVAIAHEGLGVPPVSRAGGRVAHVTDGMLSAEAPEDLLVEHLADQTEVLDDGDLASIADGDPGALLPAVLQGVEAEVGEAGHVVARCMDPEDATRIAEVVGVHLAQSIGVRRDASEATRGPRAARPRGWRRPHAHPWYT